MFLSCPPEVESLASRTLVHLLADDAILYREIKDPKDDVVLQKDIDPLCEWKRTWQMSFNAAKWYTMHGTHKITPFEYKMDDDTLTTVNHHPFRRWIN